MPDDTSPIRRDAGSDSTERLNSAIDRMLAGGPAPVLNDSDLHDLLLLAARLRDELPDDLPDPAFRMGLKQQLTASGPIAVPRTRLASPARFPWVAAASAIAAVMLAAVSVGTLGIWLNDDAERPTEFANISASQLTATTRGIATTTAEANPGIVGTTLDATTPGGPSSMTAIQPSGEPTESADETPPTEAATETPATETAPSTRTIELTSTSESTEGPSLASVPPVDGQSVEQGPQPAVDGGGGAVPTNVSYVLETELPDLGSDAQVYRFAPPSVDPETFVASVAADMGLQGEVISDVPQGKTVYHLFDDARGSFHWTPETGAFTLTAIQTGTGESVPLDQVVTAASDWLAEIGYPVDQLATDIRAEPMSEGSWRLEARYASMPDIGLGHPLGVTIYANADGTITEASGYWLDVKQTDSALLLPAEDIWQAVSSGQGYWTGGGIVEAGGEFRADTMQITYILTRDPSGELVLQPVVQTTGEFTTADGLSSARISCFVQAARTTAP